MGQTRIGEEQINLDRINGVLAVKADLVNGRVPYSQLPDIIEGKGADTTLSNVKSIDDASAVKAALDTKADLDLINTGRISNCITKIPQDIKLELSADGTLSFNGNIYIPNGVNNFEKLAVSISRKLAGQTSEGEYLLYVNDRSFLTANSRSYYGPSAPEDTYCFWYDTTNNKIKYKGSSREDWVDYSTCLPIAKIYMTSAGVTAILQVFNGFGYIGSAIFALPGVEGLVPNGRNAEGLNNTRFAVSQVLLKNAPTNSCGYITLNSNAISSPPVSTYSYNSDNNLNYFLGNRAYDAIVGLYISDTNSKITSFNPRTSFHAVDYGDTNHIAVQGKPSEKSKDLTLSSSGAQYTAPANGWFYLEKTANSGEYIEIKDGVGGASQYAAADGQGLKLLYPAKVGKIVTISYTASGTTGAFRFIYDEGAK